MNTRRSDAKDHARAHMKGIWAAALMPFAEDRSIDEQGFRKNLRHWVDDLGIDGVFVAGKQEFFSMSVAEPKRSFEITVDEIGGSAGTIASCSDQNMDVVIELARHAQAVGAEYIVVHAPVLHFLHKQEETLFQYYKAISEQVDLGIAMWSHPDSGYLMSPELCARIAELPNIVAIKYSVPREMYARLTRLAGRQAVRQHRLGGGVVRQHRRARLAALSLLVTALPVPDQGGPAHARIHRPGVCRRGGEGQGGARQPQPGARGVPRDLATAGKAPAHSKYWQELLGQVGGRVRPPMLELTAAEKETTRRAFETCGLKANGSVKSSAA